LLVLASSLGAAAQAASEPVEVVSPNGRVRLGLSFPVVDGAALPRVAIRFGDFPVIDHSDVGVDFADGRGLGRDTERIDATTRVVTDDFTQRTGKRSRVRATGRETVVRLRERGPQPLLWELVLRAYDDGVAFRYRFPHQPGLERLEIVRERTEFRFPPAAPGTVLPLNGFTTSYEKRYVTRPLGELSRDWLLALPVLVELQGLGWAAVTEADVEEYAGTYLAPAGDGRLVSRLSPLPGEGEVAVLAPAAHESPWRVVLLGTSAGALVESDLVLVLSDPLAIDDPGWIRSGKTTFPWWNGFYEENVPFKPDLNTATAKHYIDFCAANGIPCHSLDGVRNEAWYGGPITPYRGAAPLQGVDGLDLPEVLRYAREKGVRIRLWMNWRAAEAHMERAFPLYREWGVEGVMLDFMDRDDQEMNRFVRRAVALAAENRLTVTLHGCPKPTGLERTYPNLLTHEGVMNLEYDKWDKIGITPEHEVTIPFTRMLAGPLDFHQGSFRTVAQAEFRPRNDAPLVIGTPARTLAGYVVFQNHLSMVADYPTAYRDHPGVPLLAAIPTTWDDTRVVAGEPGRFIVVARRAGDAWHVGAMTDGTARRLSIPLEFLGAGQFSASIAEDDATAPRGLGIRSENVDATKGLTVDLSAAGGAYVRLAPR
jgi:alpha-glucosidase